MYLFAVLSNPELPLDLTEDRYNQITRREYPYVRMRSDEKPRHYALCPECQNPVQLVNRSVSSTESTTLYAKHFKISLEGLANYDQDAYDDCQLATPIGWKQKQGENREIKPTKLKTSFQNILILSLTMQSQ